MITRDRAEAAWAEAARLIGFANAEELATTQSTLAVSESVGQRRQQALLDRYQRSRIRAICRSTRTCWLGYPHLEEAYWFGEGVLPELRRRDRI